MTRLDDKLYSFIRSLTKPTVIIRLVTVLSFVLLASLVVNGGAHLRGWGPLDPFALAVVTASGLIALAVVREPSR